VNSSPKPPLSETLVRLLGALAAGRRAEPGILGQYPAVVSRRPFANCDHHRSRSRVRGSTLPRLFIDGRVSRTARYGCVGVLGQRWVGGPDALLVGSGGRRWSPPVEAVLGGSACCRRAPRRSVAAPANLSLVRGVEAERPVIGVGASVGHLSPRPLFVRGPRRRPSFSKGTSPPAAQPP